ncbi:MAG: hypothetical protein COS94_07140 [Candidatus Hydrogenedentes bacterium CG07_land_8_20_14_0_80_42_17]|nr:MAG: hypothetical protein COS94_07140 [Candidatus Hydrogenedentes bacterium CG07_land_8_20_14_0_80_42_17]
MKNENWKNKIFNLHFPICNFKYNGRCHGGTGAPRQWTPRVNGRHASMDATRQRKCEIIEK